MYPFGKATRHSNGPTLSLPFHRAHPKSTNHPSPSSAARGLNVAARGHSPSRLGHFVSAAATLEFTPSIWNSNNSLRPLRERYEQATEDVRQYLACRDGRAQTPWTIAMREA